MTATLATPDVIGQTRLYLADVDHKSAQEIRSAVSDFYRDFPTVAPLLADVKIDPVFFADKRDSYAMTMPDVVTEPLPPFHVRLNAYWFAGTESRERFRRAAHQDFIRGFHGYPQTSGTIIHELGHVIDMTAAHYCGLNIGASAYAVDEWDAPSISGYALEGGPMEAWADAFAARRLGYSPGNANVVRALDVVISEATRP
jgi:hypothetical protein